MDLITGKSARIPISSLKSPFTVGKGFLGQIEADVVENGGFDDTSIWKLTGAGMSISGGTANHVPGGAGQLEQTGILIASQKYRIGFDSNTVLAGILEAKLHSTLVRTIDSIGNVHITEYGIADGANLRFEADANYEGNIDNVECWGVSDGTIVKFNDNGDQTGYLDINDLTGTLLPGGLIEDTNGGQAICDGEISNRIGNWERIEILEDTVFAIKGLEHDGLSVEGLEGKVIPKGTNLLGGFTEIQTESGSIIAYKKH